MEAIKTSLCRRLFSATAALGISYLMAHASPALADTTTLTCEGEIADSIGNSRQPWHSAIDIDYASGRISISSLLSYEWTFRSAAVVTDRTIKFQANSDPDNRTLRSLSGVIDRLAGTLDLSMVLYSNGVTDNIAIQGHCRPATQKF